MTHADAVCEEALRFNELSWFRRRMYVLNVILFKVKVKVKKFCLS